jgi:Protein of unknown function (DUF1822)
MFHRQTLEDAAVPIFITQDAQQTAQGFADQQPTPQKAEQVYLNTLAVCVVTNYLRILGISANPAACDSWNPLMRLTTNTADLEVVGLGRLECRPISTTALNSTDPVCYVPTEVHDDRIGYVVVHIDEAHVEATLLGFTDRVEVEELPLSQLRSLTELPAYLDSLKPTINLVTHLSQWLQNAVEEGWRSLDDLLGLQPLAVQWRSSAPSETDSSADTFARVVRGKLIDLGSQRPGKQVVLVAEVAFQSESEMAIKLMIYPIEDQMYLPPDLEVMILDAAGVVVMQAQAREANQSIELEFSGELGDCFRLRMALADWSTEESFTI